MEDCIQSSFPSFVTPVADAGASVCVVVADCFAQFCA